MNRKKIMVVEDEKLSMLFIIESLEEEGYTDIEEFSFGENIINRIKSNNIPDLILMDINIKGSKDGIQTAKEILNYCQIPIVFMSAYNDKKTIREVFSVSLYGFLSKPFNERELFIAMELAFQNFESQCKKLQTKKKTKVKLFESCYYELESKIVFLENKKIVLAGNQKILLDVLIKHLNHTIDKIQLSFEIWSTKEESPSSLRTAIYLLRKKLKGIDICVHNKCGYQLRGQFL